MYYSDLAIENGKLLDALVVERDNVAEIFAFGLTRRVADNLFVEDIVVPDRTKIFWNDKSYIQPAEVGKFGSALAFSDELRLEVNNSQMNIVSNEAEFSFQVPRELWGTFFAKLISQACGCLINNNFEEALAQISSRGGIQLRTDWEMVVAGGNVKTSNRFFQRAKAQARERNLEMNFNIHHHPLVALFAMVVSEKPREKRNNFFSQLLTPSLSDLFAMDEADADWFEIRSFGTPENVRSTDTTKRYFDMREIRQQKPLVAGIVESLFALKPGGPANEDFTQLQPKALQLVAWAASRNLSLPSLIGYSIGLEKFAELKSKAEKLHDSTHERDRLIIQLFKEQ